MPSSRCVVRGCSNVAGHHISIHTSPNDRRERQKWINFVKLHRANFTPSGVFAICSDHFSPDCFHRTIPVASGTRRLKRGSCPSIWKQAEPVPFTERKRREVQITVFLTIGNILISVEL